MLAVNKLKKTVFVPSSGFYTNICSAKPANSSAGSPLWWRHSCYLDLISCISLLLLLLLLFNRPEEEIKNMWGENPPKVPDESLSTWARTCRWRVGGRWQRWRLWSARERVCACVRVRVIRANRADVGNCVTGAINGTRASFRIFMVRLRPSLGGLLTRGAPVRPTAVLQGPGKGRETSLLSWD